MKNKRENDKRVVVSVVVAIAAMIVLLGSATFAYLGSQIDDEGSATINAKVEDVSSDLLIFNAGPGFTYNDDMLATTLNFAEGDGNLTKNNDSNVILTTGKDNATYNYDIVLNDITNDFEYTSGKCHTNPGTKEASYTTKAQCDSNGGLWARANGETAYSCYSNSGSDITDTTLNKSAALCTAGGNNIWLLNNASELALDVFKESNDNKTTCLNGGICVNDKRETQTSYTTQSNCETNHYTWVANEYDDDNSVCYKANKSMDVTTTTSDTTILSNESISATSASGKTNHYRFKLNVINLSTIQNENSGHEFSAKITFNNTTN